MPTGHESARQCGLLEVKQSSFLPTKKPCLNLLPHTLLRNVKPRGKWGISHRGKERGQGLVQVPRPRGAPLRGAGDTLETTCPSLLPREAQQKHPAGPPGAQHRLDYRKTAYVVTKPSDALTETRGVFACLSTE